MILPLAFAVLAFVGMMEAAAGVALVRRFRAGPTRVPHRTPTISVLKPLKGGEPRLEEALTSFLAQDYPTFEIVFGAADPDDEALALARRVARRFPDRATTFIAGPHTGPLQEASNRKVANLAAMLPLARGEIVVIADQDVHAPPGTLAGLAGALEDPRVGLASVLYTGIAGAPGLIGRLGASRITHDFLPAALLGRAFGRTDTFGATMALRREVLDRIGGFETLLFELADDAVLGRKVKALGLKVALAGAVVGTTVAEASLRALFRHELRWARTIRSLAPWGFAASALAYPLVFAALAVAASGGAPWAFALFVLTALARAFFARAIDRALGIPRAVLPGWAFFLRDILSFTELLVSYAGNRVEWRGAVLRAGRPGRGTCAPVSQKGFQSR